MHGTMDIKKAQTLFFFFLFYFFFFLNKKNPVKGFIWQSSQIGMEQWRNDELEETSVLP
jgi:hypothetical protein